MLILIASSNVLPIINENGMRMMRRGTMSVDGVHECENGNRGENEAGDDCGDADGCDGENIPTALYIFLEDSKKSSASKFLFWRNLLMPAL